MELRTDALKLITPNYFALKYNEAMCSFAFDIIQVKGEQRHRTQYIVCLFILCDGQIAKMTFLDSCQILGT